MNGQIELSAESKSHGDPLGERALIDTLTSAASSEQQRIKEGTRQLQKWETKAGYYCLLQDVFLYNKLPFELRLMAIIQLKNGVDKYWRKSATNAISSDERTKVRSRLLLGGLTEENTQLVSYNSLVIAKVARFDFPLQWPDLVKEIIELLRKSTEPNVQSQHLLNVLIILRHVIKELATIRIQRSKVALQSVTPELFQVLQSIYMLKFQEWSSHISGDIKNMETHVSSPLVQSLLTMKIIRHLILAGYEFPSKDKDVQDFWEVTKVHMNVCLNLCIGGVDNQAELVALKHVIQYAKLHVEVARAHPTSFALLPGTIPLVVAYWNFAAIMRDQLGAIQNLDAPQGKTSFEKIILLSLRILRASLRLVFNPPPQSFKYRHAEDKEEPGKAKSLFKQYLLTDIFVNQMMETLVTKYFMLLPGDLEQWFEEPEEWDMRTESDEDAYDISIRPCAERLFLDLTVHYKQLLTQPLLAVFARVNSSEFDDVLVKDAVYSAVGLAASTLHEHIDFDSFLSTSLLTEMQKKHPRSNILRRRVAILLAQWISVKISEANRPLVYQIFQYLLDKTDVSNDQVVRVTAGKRFKDVVNEWEFKPEQFTPYAADILGRLITLIKEVELVETKLALLDTLSVLVERMDQGIRSFADQIVALLPALWEQSPEEHLMKQAVLVILVRLVRALKASSAPLQSMVLPTIQGTLQPGSETQVYLLEDALDLWHAILVHAEQPASPELLAQAPLLFPVFELGSENLQKALQIAESYLLLAPDMMLAEEMRNKLLGAFTSLLGVVKSHMVNEVTILVELMIRQAVRLGGAQAVQVIAASLTDCGFLIKIIDGIKGNWAAHETTGPNRKDPPLDTLCETYYLSTFARIILADGGTNAFLSSMQTYGEDYGESPEQSMNWLLAEWLNHMDSVGVPTDSKLLCLAMTKLLETGQTWILIKLQDLMAMWTSIVTELQDGEDNFGSDSLVYKNPGELGQDLNVPEERRNNELTIQDPIHAVNTVQYIRHHLSIAIYASGGETRFQEDWLANVDKEVVKAFGALNVM